MPFGGIRLTFSAFATALLRAGLVAICMLLSALQAVAQNATPAFDFAGLVFEADELQQSEDGETIFLRGNVIIEDSERVLIADRLTINRTERRAAASGNVALDLGDGQTLFSDALLLDQSTTTMLLSGLSVRLRTNAVLAAAKASTNGQVLTLDYAAYTACEAPCDIDLYRERTPLPWRLTARKVTLDQGTEMLHMRGLKLELFGVPVVGLPRLSVAAPSVTRRSGFLTPIVGYEPGLGVWGGLPLYLVTGPSTDVTLTPVGYSSGLSRMDFEHRIHSNSLEATLTGTLDAQGRAGAMTEARLDLSSVHDLSFTLDWAGEIDPGTLHTLDQTRVDLHENRLALTTAHGHSFVELALVQDRVLTTDDDWATLGWNEQWIPRARYDWRLPALDNGSRLRVSGQGLLLNDLGLVESNAAWNARAVTGSGLAVMPVLETGFIGSDTSGAFSPWVGAQLGAALPLVRQDRQSSITLTPTLAVTGLSAASIDAESPHADHVLLSRSNMFDVRPAGNPYGHHSDLRVDAALDVALYPHDTDGKFGLRGSLGQRISWSDTALMPALAELQVQAGDLKVALQAEIQPLALLHGAAQWSGSEEKQPMDAHAVTGATVLPRLAVNASVPLAPYITLSGRHNRLKTALDQRAISAVRLDVQLTSALSSSLGIRTQKTGTNAINMDVEAELGWNITGDWIAETALRQNIFDRRDQDISFDLYHRCDCLGAQLGVLRERTAEGTSYSARFALDLPTLFSGKISPKVFEHR